MTLDEITTGITDHYGRLVKIKHPFDVMNHLLYPGSQFIVEDYACAFLFDHETSLTIMRQRDGNSIVYSLCLPGAFLSFDSSHAGLLAITFFDWAVLKLGA